MPPRLHTKHHTRMVHRKSVPITYYRGMRCTCVVYVANAPQARANCCACQGSGFTYDPATATGMFAAVSIQMAETQTPYGATIPAHATITPPPSWFGWKEGDMVQLEHFSGIPIPTRADYVLRGVGNDPDSDGLTYPIMELDSITTNDPSGVVGNTTTYAEGIDFTIGSNRQSINWIGSHAPAPSTYYAVRYSAQYQLIITEPPTVRLEGATRNYGASYTATFRHALIAQSLPNSSPDSHLGITPIPGEVAFVAQVVS